MASPLGCVQASLKALKECCDGLEIELDGQIVTRADRHSFPERVKIISGGGAGHEPGHFGFVGQAFLTTAVSGAIFTSPPAQAILKGILLTGPPESSILLIVTNYSGDRLNFALAEQMARVRHGYQHIRTVLVADDVALDDVPEQVGNRGLAGTILVHKIAGAMAEEGKSLDSVHSLCEIVIKNLSTIGFSFDVDWTSNRIGNIEIGKGVHGEPGAFKMEDQDDFSEIVRFISDKFQRAVPAGTAVVLLLNNLGGPLHIFQLICNAMINQLQFLKIIKIISGTLFTSLSNTGASVTLLRLPQEQHEEILSYIEYKTDIFWDIFKPQSNRSSIIAPFDGSENASDRAEEIGVRINGELFFSILMRICEKIIEQKSALNEMDSEFGDGDTGDTLARGAAAISDHYQNEAEHHTFDWPVAVFQTISYLLSSKMGGTSGALLGIFFEAASEAFKTNGFDSPLWLQLGNNALATAGRSKRGHRTMLDVLLVAQDIMEVSSVIDEQLLLQLSLQCTLTAESTREMVPGSGRAVYSRQIKKESNHADPGAVFIALVVETVVKGLLEN